MSLIRKGLLIGNYRDAEDLKFLQTYGITHILCSARELQPVFPRKFIYKHIPADDVPSYNLMRYFDTGADFIHSAIESGGTVFVHCAAGISRSVSLCLAYFIKYEEMRLGNAFNLVKSRRHIVNPNNGFMKQLREYESRMEAQRNRIKHTAPEFSRFTPPKHSKYGEDQKESIKKHPVIELDTRSSRYQLQESVRKPAKSMSVYQAAPRGLSRSYQAPSYPVSSGINPSESSFKDYLASGRSNSKYSAIFDERLDSRRVPAHHLRNSVGIRATDGIYDNNHPYSKYIRPDKTMESTRYLQDRDYPSSNIYSGYSKLYKAANEPLAPGIVRRTPYGNSGANPKQKFFHAGVSPNARVYMGPNMRNSSQLASHSNLYDYY